MSTAGASWVAISGVGTMSSSQRSKILERFKRGGERVLVATVALEEGLDVSDCQFVVRYSRFHVPKSHIQGAGRARHTITPPASLIRSKRCTSQSSSGFLPADFLFLSSLSNLFRELLLSQLAKPSEKSRLGNRFE